MSSKTTPMMAQYFEIKAQYQDAFLFFRLGDFYELFCDDAINAAKILEITLTSRNKNAENPIPMCGVPYHSAQDYIKRLIEAGHKVAICEQVEDPKVTKGMVKREVVQVITPGTLLSETTGAKENHYLAATLYLAGIYYLAYVDVSTGEVHLTSTAQQMQWLNELVAIQANEYVLDVASDTSLVESIQARTSAFLSYYPLEALNSEASKWQLTNASEGEAQVLNLLFNYLYSIQKRPLLYLQAVARYELKNYLQMNHYAKAQLELTKSLRTGRKEGSLLWLIDHTKTAMGGRLLHQWLEKPLIDRQQLLKRHEQVAAFMQSYFERIDLVNLFDRVYDLERLVGRISHGTANARDLDHLRHSLRQIPAMNQLLIQINQQYGNVIFTPLADYSHIVARLDDVMVENPPFSVTDGDIIRPGYNESLDRYRDALQNGHQWLNELQQRERDITGIKTLKVGYNKVFGYYLEMSRLQSQQFEDTRYQRKQTLSNAERFITDELKELEATIFGAQEKATALEYELFTALRQEMSQYTAEFQELAGQIATYDVLANFATLSEREDYCRPVLAKQAKQFELLESRHPAIEKLIGRAAFVANDFNVSPEQPLLLLTGPNMSGKSTYMRQIAFCVVLNQIGCFVPAKQAVLPIVDKIFTRIGSADDIASGQSTFMVEMMETNVALQEATPNSLLLFDEIGRGTATFDGMALAEAILYYIANQLQAVTIFSTHYHELTSLESKIPTLRNIHVGASERNGQVVFLHKVLEGPADKSYGIHVAQLAGLPASVIAQSRQVLAELEYNGQWLRQGQEDAPVQTSLLQAVNVTEENQTYQTVIEQLKAEDINQLTPMAALQFLAALQQQLRT